MIKSSGLVLALLGLCVLACSSPQAQAGPSAEEDLAAIAVARAALQEALASDDVPGIMAGLTEDHLTMAPNGPTPPDNTVLAEWHRTRVEQFAFESDFTTDEVRVFGDIAIERWSSDMRLMPREGGEDVVDSTKGVWIWQRQEDGSWKLLWSIWNSNLPVETTLPTEEGA